MSDKETRYVGISTVGIPSAVLERVRNVVQQLNFMRRIPVIKIEKRPRRQFYIFLAIQGATDDRLPDDVLNVLRLVVSQVDFEVQSSSFSLLTCKPQPKG